jgi:hypothetical protein
LLLRHLGVTGKEKIKCRMTRVKEFKKGREKRTAKEADKE